MGKISKILNPSNFRRTALYLQKNGVKNAWYAAQERIREQAGERYVFQEMSAEERKEQSVLGRRLFEKTGLTFCILVPAYETREPYLRELIRSVEEQTYPGYELLIADAGADGRVERIVREASGSGKLRYVRLDGNQGISGNSNAALSYARGDYVCLLDHDDTLARGALYELALAASGRTGSGRAFQGPAGGGTRLPALLYTDEDKMDSAGRKYYEPHRKEDFNLDLLLSNNYICHFLAVRRDLFEEIRFRTLYDGAQDYDLILQCVGKCLRNGEEDFVHIPKILYHWRCHEQSTAVNPSSKMYAYEAGRKAVSDFCRDMGWKVWVRHEKHLGFYEVRYEGDIFRIRKDIGAAGGRLLCGGKICGGAYGKDGEILYEGLNANFSGYMHRAALRQDVYAVDIRFMALRKGLEETAAEAVRAVCGQDGRLRFEEPQADERGVRKDYVIARFEGGGDGELIRRCSLAVGESVRKAGLRILFDPKAEKTVEKRGKA